jgi:effector-binding domain-containing protein
MPAAAKLGTARASVLESRRGDRIKKAATARQPATRITGAEENRMLLRFAPCIAAAALYVVALSPVAIVAGSQASWAQTPPAPAATSPAAEPFAEDTTLTAKTIVYVKGSGVWDSAFGTISSSFKKLKAYIDKEGLKTDGPPMTVFTQTDDTGFQFQAAVPIAEPPKNPPRGDIAVGQSPEGHALKFIHHGSYEELDNTYEAITNYLDEKRLEAKDLFIEQYETDPATADGKKLTIDVLVLLK